ncbi:MAG: 30S ribosome-binding factor RbfA [Alphaproteobacteria bacterium]
MTAPAEGPRSPRQLRVGEEVRHALTRILAEGGFRDPDLQDIIVTVSECRVSPDMKNVSAFVLPLGGKDAEKIVKALNRASPFIRGRLAHEINLRHALRVSFLVDRSFDEASRIEAVLRQERVQRDLKKSDDED